MRPSALLLLALSFVAASSTARAAEPRTLSLDEALDALAEHNPGLAQARAQADQARGMARQATAPLLPTLGAQASYVRNSHEATASFTDLFNKLEDVLNEFSPAAVEIDTSGLPGDLVIQPLDAFNAGATLRVPLVNASAWANRRAAGRAVTAAEAGSSAAELQLTRSFVEACWMASAAEEVVAAAQVAADSARAHRDATDRLHEAGLATNLELLRAETEVAQREGDLAEARAGLDRAQLSLGALLGEGDPVRVAMPTEPDATMAGQAELLDRARAARPELAARQAEVDARQAALSAARLRVLPTLAASGTAFASDEQFPTGETWGWKVGVDLTWAAYDGGYRYGKAQEAKAALAGARAGLDAAELQVGLELRQALDDVAVARERLRLAQQASAMATEAEAAAQRGFEAGLVSNLEVLDAQERRFGAQVGLARARAGVGAAQARLRAASGQGW